MLVKPRLRDEAMSDMIGTSILLAVTVVIVAASVVALSSAPGAEADAPHIDLVATAEASPDGVVTLRHVGGPALATGAVQVVVSSSSWPDPTPPRDLVVTGDSFELGLPGEVELGRALAVSDRVEVLLYSKATGDLLGQASFVVAPPDGATAPPDVFTLTVTDPSLAGRAPEPAAGGTLHVSAVVEHSGGRKTVDRVVVDLSPVGGSDSFALHDDGTMGDGLPHDGNYSAYVPIPPQAPLGEVVLFVQAYDLDGHDRDADGALARAAFLVDVQPAIDISTLNGFNGNNGNNGNNGAAAEPLTGPQGPAGSNGANAGATGTPPEIFDMDPVVGAPGELVLLTGYALGNVTSVHLAVEGEEVGYSTTFSAPPDVTDGTQLLFTVPVIAELEYVVTVTTSGGFFDTANETFTVELPQPRITAITPDEAVPYTPVSVTGTSFTGVISVTLDAIATPLDDAIAVPWSPVDDGRLVFVTHPGLLAGFYRLSVSNGAHNDSHETQFKALPASTPPEPQITDVDPEFGSVGEEIVVEGLFLEETFRVTVNDSGRTTDAVSWVASSKVHFYVPATAATGLSTVKVYTPGGTASYYPFDVRPPPPPTITDFCAPPTGGAGCPKTGEPYTAITLNGTHLATTKGVTLDSDTLGIKTVAFTVLSDNQLIVMTHNGIVPGDYYVTVTTSTGSATSTDVFTAVEPKEVNVYAKQLISALGHKAVTTDGGTPGDEVEIWVKLHLIADPVDISGAKYYFNPLTNTTEKDYTDLDLDPPQIKYTPFTSSATAEAFPFTVQCKPAANSDGGRPGVWILKLDPTTVSKYHHAFGTFSYYYTFGWLSWAKQGNSYNVVDGFTSDARSSTIDTYFDLDPTSDTKEVLDNGWPLNYNTEAGGTCNAN